MCKKWVAELQGKKVCINFAQNIEICAIMVLKTRDRLIEVARQLFARKGIENTTMNDIASASDKGRRTVYTYFRNKRDIFNAVVEQETETLLRKLTEIENKDISPTLKLEQYIVCRFETMREIVSRNGSLKAGFFRDVRKVDRARKLISTHEIEILSRIIKQGQQAGQFGECNAEHTATVVVHCIHGLDIPYIRDNLADQGLDQTAVMRVVTEMILNGLRRRLPCEMPVDEGSLLGV